MGKQVLRYCHKLLKAFNDGDGNACAKLYDAVAMLRSPDRQFIIGTADIEAFWDDIILQNNGTAELERVSIVFDDHDYFIAESQWRFSNGVELSIKETWCETQGDFEIIEQRISRLEAKNEELRALKDKVKPLHKPKILQGQYVAPNPVNIS
jgi:ketosteroid isomerase-like protein